MVSDLAPDLAPQATSTLVVRAHRSQLSRPLISASCMWPPLRSRTSHPCQPPTLATLRLCGSFAKSQFFSCFLVSSPAANTESVPTSKLTAWCYLVIHSSVRGSIIELFIATSKLCSTRWSPNRMCNCAVFQYHQTGRRLRILAMHQESTRMRCQVLKKMKKHLSIKGAKNDQ
ncbi:uncharacterized protein [Arachis hypogaea]|uniref:uncharacterized protein isoform X1 n=1 Tax=Arachis hypogaea TaxID=3818 RepID=UPI000A2C321D|nr:uncharacterized protein LOC112790847 isoform X1 [Arachis hypogaea]